jgi:hypothetical protein
MAAGFNPVTLSFKRDGWMDGYINIKFFRFDKIDLVH